MLYAPSNEAKVLLLMNCLQTGDLSAIEAYVSPHQYTQHNLTGVDGRDKLLTLIGGIAQGGKSGARVNIRRILSMDDLVAIHVEYSLPASNEFAVSFDVFRFKEGQIIEHWDNAIAPLGANRSGHTQMDGPITIADLDKTASNRQHVTDYVHNILIAPPNTAKLSDYISAAQFIQHSPDQSDGLAAFEQYLQSFKQGQRVMQYHKLQFVVAQGNFVLAASEGLAGDADAPKPTAFYDLFRLEQGLIVEHWDIVATIPPRADWTNDNGKF